MKRSLVSCALSLVLAFGLTPTAAFAAVNDDAQLKPQAVSVTIGSESTTYQQGYTGDGVEDYGAVIEADVATDDEVTLTWYVSSDNGATWTETNDYGEDPLDAMMPGFGAGFLFLYELPVGTYQFKAVATAGGESSESNVLTITITGAAEEEGPMFEGEGTEASPYLLSSADKLVALSAAVAEGESFAGKHFKMTADITLPADWAPIGNSAKRFKGNIDGDNHLLTVPVDGLPLLGATETASISNLNVYGERIAGYGLVNIYTTGSSTACITIKNVTLKTGSSTLKSGFIGGYASGSHSITIEDCTIEAGVTIGYDGQQSNIGSFAGELNGTVKNCVSHATVKGVNFVGGIVADKGQSMGTFAIENCTFDGTVEATGNYAGGILGAGYAGTSWGMGSAPNAPCPTIIGCTMAGSVTGVGRVGGILGGEGAVYQAWDDGIGIIKDNYVSGTVTGTSETGAIIGFIAGLNVNNVIENNVYAHGVAPAGIGRIEWVDTSCENPAVVEGTTYLNSSVALPDFKAGTGPWDPKCFTRSNYNRTDDPLGADADKLCKAMTYFEAETSIVADEPVKAGDTFTVNVTLTANDGAACMEATLDYDPAELELVSVVKGAGLSEGASFIGEAEDGTFSFQANEADAKGGIVVATATFKALKASEGAKVGVKDATAGLSVDPKEYGVTVGEPASVVVLAAALLGDANNSGKVNIVDAQIVYDMSTNKYGEDYVNYPLPSGWTMATLRWVCDVNADKLPGIDAIDAFAIQYYVHYQSWN